MSTKGFRAVETLCEPTTRDTCHDTSVHHTQNGQDQGRPLRWMVDLGRHDVSAGS